ncbi:MAG: hypothetical protein IT384_03390 [Deltaproteobacteria bacterium]|nr:hypothetical protein [Deltaproteobacteria bacterium]
MPIGATCDEAHLSPTHCESGYCSADHVCTAPLVLGDPCSADCWRCCPGGTYCSSQTGHCEAALPEGSPCASGSYELQCAGYDVGCPRETPDATCTRLRRIGETCQPGKGECVFYYPCAVQPDGSFICSLFASLGQPCNEHQLEPLFCRDGRCSNAMGPGTCIPRTPIGEPCTSHDECQDFVCDQGICVRSFSCP